MGILDVAKREGLGDYRAQCSRLQPLQNKRLGTFKDFWVGHNFCIEIALEG